MAPSIYDFPEIYATLMYPEPDLLEDMFRWVGEHLGGGEVASVMDPCCGPGTWLLPWAARGRRVAGNDLAPGMIAAARERLEGFDAELVVGDMRHPAFEGAPFDLGVNVHASVGHLKSLAAIEEHLVSMAALLRPGGLYLLGCVINDGRSVETTVEDLYESDPTPMPSGGMAACHYRSIHRDHVAGVETIEVLVLTHEVSGVPERFTDRYSLLTLRAEEVEALIETNGRFELCAVHAMVDEERGAIDLRPGARDVTLILRRT